jgi:hypothetical protein
LGREILWEMLTPNVRYRFINSFSRKLMALCIMSLFGPVK